MGAARKRKVRDHYDELGGTVYDAQYGEEQPPKYALALRLTPPPGEGLLLDDGCGTGTFLEGLGLMGVGLDLSGSLLSVAKLKLRRESHLVQGDAEFLPLRGSIFAVVYSFTLLQNTSDPATALAEMARVARSGSWVVVTTIRKASTRENFESLMASQAWAELHFSDEDSHDLIAYAKVRAREA